MVNKSQKLQKLACRPALESDTADVITLTRDIWDGEDYVPHVWQEWLNDPEGLLAVAEYNGHVVGISKLTKLTLDDWWLEGLRVHPEYEGGGVASLLHDYLLDHWQKQGRGTIRLATSSERKQVHHLCKRTGFDRIGEFTYHKAEATPGSTTNFFPVSSGEITKSLQIIMDSPALEISYGLMDLGWQWATPSETLINSAIEDGNALWWRKLESRLDGLILYWVDDWENTEHRRKPIMMIKLLICRIEEIQQYLLDVRRYAADRGYSHVGWLNPIRPVIESVLPSAGFQREWDGSLYLFAKRHGK